MQCIIIAMNNIENLGIYDLRNYARSVGVSSPTTKKREVLICEIYEILSGKKRIEKNNNKGRKTKDVALKINGNLPFTDIRNESLILLNDILEFSKKIESKAEEIKQLILER